jgi:serine phosphatase RsbU (regulator of sigma subunit)
MNVAGEEFGSARLVEIVERFRDATPRHLVDAIFDAVEGFRAGAVQNDDMTAVAVRIIA